MDGGPLVSAHPIPQPGGSDFNGNDPCLDFHDGIDKNSPVPEIHLKHTVRRRRSCCGLLCFLLAVLVVLARGSAFGEDVQFGPPEEPEGKITLNIPYAFYNDNFGFAVGYVYSVIRYPERQSALMATAMVGTKGSAMVFLMGQDLRLLGLSRLFMDPIVSVGYFKEADVYVSGNPHFPGMVAGSNDSDEDDFVTGNGWDNFFRLTFKYLLPIGYGREHLITEYHVRGGLLESGASGGTNWNPATSGMTYLQVRPFYRSQQINGDTVDSKQKTNGFDFSVFWDNRDFSPNPSRGNSLLLKMSRDFGWFDSSNSWTVVAGELDKYFSLGSTEWFRQRVFALDLWSAYSPTWDAQPDGTIDHRSRPMPAPRWAVCGSCAAIPRSDSAIKRGFITASSSA
jgi:hypothetical protein